MNIVKRKSANGQKKYYSFDFGRCAGKRIRTGIFIHLCPKDQVEKNHNKEVLKILKVKKSELTIEQQAIGSG
jgi:hypothetical protein